MIYFGVQKNVGPAGVVVAIIREDLIRDDVMPFTPTMLKYKTQADADSLYNTPPCYGIYICGKSEESQEIHNYRQQNNHGVH
jgi:serC_1: phosphoserine transaminase